MSLLIFVDESNVNKSLTTQRKDATGYSQSVIKKKTPRPMNAFLLYRQTKQKNLQFKEKILSKDFSKAVAEMWRSEKEEVRSYYHRLAEEEKLKHRNKYPNYKYSPRQKNKQNLEDLDRRFVSTSVNQIENNQPIHQEAQIDFEFNITTPPSLMIRDLQEYRDGSSLDILSLDCDLYTLLSFLPEY